MKNNKCIEKERIIDIPLRSMLEEKVASSCSIYITSLGILLPSPSLIYCIY